ncbi:hypothetical protein HID58_043632 [Brassica napus]|uniref:Uncharacterized protein n=1 Tax=Brassica napus TaxID=3708 RepID=A0ABQ8BH27_BRANA|nr:hypothetical protein HID58_043632 [Brassica napus]
MDGHLFPAPAVTGSWRKRAPPCYICVSSNITGVLRFNLYTQTNFLILHSYIYASDIDILSFKMPSGGFQDASTLSSIYVSLNTITTSTIIPSPSTQSEKMSSLALNHRLAASTKLQDATSKLGYVQHLLATKLMRPAKELGMMNQIQRAWKRKETVANASISDSCRSLFLSLYFQLLSFKKN